MTEVKKELTAHGPWVLLKVAPKMSETKAGIVIPDTATEHNMGYCQGTVVSVGSGVCSGKGDRRRLQIEKGEVVVMRKYLTDINHIALEDNHAFVHMDDLIAAIEGSEKIEIMRSS